MSSSALEKKKTNYRVVYVIRNGNITHSSRYTNGISKCHNNISRSDSEKVNFYDNLNTKKRYISVNSALLQACIYILT